MSAQRPRPWELWINDDCREKLAAHDLRFEDAHWAMSHDPLWLWQKAQAETGGHGELRSRPGRWRLIGRALSGQVIAVVLEAPGLDGRSQVVTAYEAPGRDRARYDDYQRRRRARR